MDDRTCVYQYFDASGRLLYVGITGRGLTRAHEHARSKQWWHLTSGCTIEHYATRAEASSREAYLISAYKPEFNVQGKSRPAASFVRLSRVGEHLPTEHGEQMGRVLDELRQLVASGEWKKAIQRWMELPSRWKALVGCLACRQRPGNHGAMCRPCYEIYVNGETRSVRRERFRRTGLWEQVANHS